MIIKELTKIQSHPLFYELTDFANANTYLKLEGLNIANSIKIKTAVFLIESLENKNIIRPGQHKIIESSSGNLGVALSIVCKQKGYTFTCVTDPNISPNNENLMNLYGCNVIKVTEKDAAGGYLSTRIKLIRNMLDQDSNLVWTNQYENLSNVDAHFNLTAQEIYKEFSTIDYLFIGAGTTGTLMGCLRYFRQYSPSTKILAVDAYGSVTFGGKSAKRYIPGLGTSKSPKLSQLEKPDELIYIQEEDTIKMCRYLLRKYGLFVGGSTGTVLHAVKKHEKCFATGDTIVAISPDFGSNYLNTIYTDSWVKSVFGNILEENDGI